MGTKILKSAATPSEFPKVGDWVAFTQYNSESEAVIHSVLPRKTTLSRKGVDPRPGVSSSVEQIIATNIDIICIVQSADQNFNIRRLERYLAMALAANCQPLVILNKIDLNSQWEDLVRKIKSRLTVDIPIIAMSAKDSLGKDELLSYLKQGTTSVFVGSSGVGKSSLINMLQEEDVLKVGEISETLGKGKHTTTHRELLQLSSGGIVIDTPGMRELFMWDADDAVDELFTPIVELSKACKFKNCSHTSEPGCAVIDALENEEIDPDMYEHYLQLKGEQRKFSNKRKKVSPEKERHKRFSKQIRQVVRDKERWY